MNLYETVKAAVPLREAAARYRLRQNWSGMTRCLYHEDHTPSMKLNEDYFYCFGCGTHGDVILVSDSNVDKHLNPSNGFPFDAAHHLRGDTPCHIFFCKSSGFACRSKTAADKTIGSIVLSRNSMIDLASAIFGLPPFDAARKLAWDFHVPLDKPVDPLPQRESSSEVKADLARRKDEQEQLWTSLRVLCEYQRLLRRWKEEYAPKTQDEPVEDRYVEACQMYDRIDDLTEGLTVGTEEQRERALELVTADNKITLLAERLERIRKEEGALAKKTTDFQSAPARLV